MKKLSTFILLSLLVLFSCQTVSAQPQPAMTKKYSDKQIVDMIQAIRIAHSRDITPTAALQQKLAKDFPNAKDIDWEAGANIYEVEFEIGRTDYKAYYDAKGELLMYKVEIGEQELPAIIKNAARAKYPDYHFEDIDKIVRGSETFYKMELERGKIEVKLTYKKDGTLVTEYFD